MQWFIHEMYHCLSNIQIFWSCFNIYQNSRQHVLTTLLLDLGLCVREIEKGVRFGINFFVTFALWPQHWMCSVNEQCVIIDISWFFQPPWSIFPVTHGENTFMYVCMKRSHKFRIVSSPLVSSVSFAWCRHVRKISQLSLIKRGNSLPRYVMSRCSSNSEEVQDDKEINIPVIRCICIHLHILTLYPLNATFWRWNGIFSFHLKKASKDYQKKQPLLIMYNVFASVHLNTYHVYRKFTVHK